MPLFLSSVGSFESQTSFNGVNAAEANQIINSGVMQLGFWMYFCTVFTGYYIATSSPTTTPHSACSALPPLRGDDVVGRLWGYSILMVPVVVVMVSSPQQQMDTWSFSPSC